MHRIGMAEDAKRRWYVENELQVLYIWTGWCTLVRQLLIQSSYSALQGEGKFWMSYNLCVSHNRFTVAVEGRIYLLTITSYITFVSAGDSAGVSAGDMIAAQRNVKN